MSTNSKRDYFGILMGTLVFIAFATRYTDYVWAKNTVLNLYAPCDPTTESCFISDEDNAWVDIQLQPYKKVEIREKDSPQCLEEHTCESFSCGSISSCSETFCEEDALEEGEFCIQSNQETDLFEESDETQEIQTSTSTENEILMTTSNTETP